MNNQKENSRLDEDNISDKNTDVTRSENQQRSHNANEGSNVSNDATRGEGHHHGSDETGSHQEGMYDKQSSTPMVDKEGMGEA